jgi:GTP-binding protein
VDELRRYNPELLDKQSIVAISKADLLDEELKAEMTQALNKDFGNIPYMFISSVAQQGLDALKDALWRALNATID